jgi:acetyl-CoA acyltransferase
MSIPRSRETVIVEALRTPIGRYRGSLGTVRADHLGAILLNALVHRAGLDAAEVDDVIFGCVTQVGEQSANIARTAVLSAGWPVDIPGMTVDRKCGSGEAAIHAAVGAIAAGACDIVVAGGAENMSRVPLGGNRQVHGEPFGWKLSERFEMVSQGEAAERLVDRWHLAREELDEYSLVSHQRAAAATDQGRFRREIIPVPVDLWQEAQCLAAGWVLNEDETIRRDTNAAKLANLKASFRADGRVTAGNSSQLSDGAAAVLLMSAEAAARRGLKARAVIRAITTVGSDPTLMLTGPIAATERLLKRTGLNARDIELFEVNEAFAPVPLVWLRATGVSPEKLNVNGGAIALGHPLGASGARIMTTLLHELERTNATFGLQTVCCAGGLATATLLERLK